MLSADRDELRVGHSLLIVVLESVLSKLNAVLARSKADLNALRVADAHSQLLSAVSSLVDVNLTKHAGRALEGVVHGAEGLQVEMGLVLVLNLIGQIKIVVNGISHYFIPPS